MDIYICVYMCVCMCARMYIHTQTHTDLATDCVCVCVERGKQFKISVAEQITKNSRDDFVKDAQ